MIALLENKKTFTWFGICPIDEDSPKEAKTYRIFVIISFFIIQSGIFFSSFAYVIKYAANDLASALYAFFQAVGMMGCLYSAAVGILMNKKIYAIFKRYEKLYEQCK